VSVVVPVFRPGPTFDDLIASFDRQTLPATDFEVLLCDDGSGQETHARLTEVARTRSNVRVLDLPHSGWPGTPRNRGVETARGTYVQFVDQDDWLFDGALEKLCDYADLHGSDVVVGREVGIGRELPARIFRRDIPRATLGEDPLLEMLTPHKLFRTAFLRANDIRFPDGKVRLEDHLFVMQAYFAADTISILASEPCYAWVKHPGSASSSRIDPESYFPHLEAVLDLVDAHTEPGRLRDRLLRHWYRGKILKRLAGRRMLKYPAAYRERLLRVVAPLVQRRFGPGVDGGLAFPHRIRSALLRAGRWDDLVRFARFEADMECRATVTSATWSRGGGLHLTLRITITHDGHDALVFETTATGAERLVSEPWLTDLPADALLAGRELRNDRVDLVLSDIVAGEAEASERSLASRREPDLGAISVTVDPLKTFGPTDALQSAHLTAKVRRAGWTFEVPVQADPETLARAGRSPFLAGRTCELVATDDGGVELRREWPGGRLKDSAGRAMRRWRARRK
jgi:glycosyltransferase involved in cell wall biosynthesis